MQQYKQNGNNTSETKMWFTLSWPTIQGVTGGTDQTSGECSLGHTIPI